MNPADSSILEKDVPKKEQTGVPGQPPPTEDEPQRDAPTVLLDIPTPGLSIDFPSVIVAPSPEIQERASYVRKLAEENDKLEAELKAMNDRLEDAKRREKFEKKERLEMKKQEIMLEPMQAETPLVKNPYTQATMSTHEILETRASERRSSGTSSRRPSIDPSRLVAMDKTLHIGGSDAFNVVFIGAGNIMFGSPEGPWNHSFRFEHKLGRRLKVVALIDPVVERAKAALEKKCDSFVVSAYQDTRVFKTFEEFVKNMSPHDRPKAIIVGSPAMYRGSTKPGRDIELQILKHFPGVAMFIEKPIATGSEDEIADCYKIAKTIEDSNTICCIGYMLRYLKAVQQMKQIIDENNLTVMSTIARYACAYESISKPEWWDKSKSAGPIIEQGTHFCDLSRYFGGEVDITSVQAHSLEWHENAGQLSKLPIDENKILPENRIPRVTAATWKYDSGAVGSFTHVVSLQGHDYSCEFEVYADGYCLKLVNPYVLPVLYIRKPGDDNETTIRFADDDPFFSEISNLIDIIEDIEEDPDAAQILSSYEDAVRTYEFTWAIRRASEHSRAKKP